MSYLITAAAQPAADDASAPVRSTTMKEAIVKSADYDLDESKAIEIQTSFQPMIAERNVLAQEFEIIISAEIDADVCDRAGSLRRQLVKVRTGISNVHKTQKHLFFQAGRFVDAWKNAETLPVTQMEDKLREIEDHYANLELARINGIRLARIAELMMYEVVEEQLPVGLGQMEDGVWTNYLAGVKAAYENRKEQERIAEVERIAREKAEAAEREQIRIENAKLIAERDERDRLEKVRIATEAKERAIAEKARIATEAKEAKARKKIEDAARKEREEAEAKLVAEREAVEAKLKTERDERERLEKEKTKREEAERKEREAVAARTKDKAHRDTINSGIVDALMGIDGMVVGLCYEIISAIENGDIPNVHITY